MPSPPATVSSACGKIILLGEHAVVHGQTAVAASIGRSAEASARWLDGPTDELSLRDDHGAIDVAAGSELHRALRALVQTMNVRRAVGVEAHVRIPTRAGLGSSAAIGVAVARAVASLAELAPDLARDELAATAWERIFHGNPSGVDVAVAVHGGCLAFSRRDGAQPVPIAAPISLCVAQSGPRAATKAMVEAATAFLAARPGQGAEILREVRSSVQQGLLALRTGNPALLGEAMSSNQHALRAWELSTPSIDALCDAALCAGALGAKLTGAGGGGSVIALAPQRETAVLDAWHRLGFEGIVVAAGDAP